MAAPAPPRTTLAPALWASCSTAPPSTQHSSPPPPPRSSLPERSPPRALKPPRWRAACATAPTGRTSPACWMALPTRASSPAARHIRRIFRTQVRCWVTAQSMQARLARRLRLPHQWPRRRMARCRHQRLGRLPQTRPPPLRLGPLELRPLPERRIRRLVL